MLKRFGFREPTSGLYDGEKSVARKNHLNVDTKSNCWNF